MPTASSPDEYTLDIKAVRRAFDRASRTYHRAAVVQGVVRQRLLERLDVVRLDPKRVLDLGAASGESSRALTIRYPKAQVVALDLSAQMLREAARQQRLMHRFRRVVADAHQLPLRGETIDLAYSNLMLAWCNDPDGVFRETARVLRPGGLFMFATLGPDTLKELRDAFRSIDAHTHVHRFIDMHDVGDALMRASFLEPVMDTERLTVTYPSLRALVAELRASGAQNATHGRKRSPMSRRAYDTLEAHFTKSAGPIGFSLEVVYGHAWRGERRPRRDTPGEFSVPLKQIGTRRLG